MSKEKCFGITAVNSIDLPKLLKRVFYLVFLNIPTNFLATALLVEEIYTLLQTDKQTLD